MPNRTIVLTEEQVREILCVMSSDQKHPFTSKPEHAAALELVATTGNKLSKILKIRRENIRSTKHGYILNLNNIDYPVRGTVWYYFTKKIGWIDKNGFIRKEHYMEPDALIFPIQKRAIETYLSKVAGSLGYHDVGPESFRKFFAMDIYDRSHDIFLVKNILGHTNIADTYNYLNLPDKTTQSSIKKAINEHYDAFYKS